MPKSFQPIASAKVSGHLQAVSDDGKAVIYRTHDIVQLHYFNGSAITTQTYQLPGALTAPDEDYNQEHSFHHTLVKVVGDRVIVYMNLNTIFLKVEFTDYRSSEVDFQSGLLPEPIFDIAIDPFDNSLIALGKFNMYVLFQNENYSVPLDFGTLLENNTYNAKLYVHPDFTTKYYYFIFLQENDSPQLDIIKFAEPAKYQFQISAYQSFVFNVEKKFDIFEGVSFDDKQQILAIRNDHINQAEGTRESSLMFIDRSLNGFTYEGTIPSTRFHTFMRGRDAFVLGNFFSWDLASLYEQQLEQICVVPFEISGETITFDGDEEKCLAGFFDRVSSWEMGGETYLLTHIDRGLTLRQSITEESFAFLEATAFSTKLPDILILENHGQLHYTQWKQVEASPPPEPPAQQCEGCVGITVAPFVIICVLLGLFFLLSILLAVCLCRKNLHEETSAGTNPGISSSQNLNKPEFKRQQSGQTL